MAVTQNTYTGDGTTVLFSFTFPYLETTDIKVSLNGTVTTAYTLANATTIQFNTAPANGAAIRIYRQTDDASLAAQFYPGSAIRSSDLNDNFTQNLYVTQESSNNAATATSTANTALTNSNTAIGTANTALSTANTASSNASAAVSTANTASTNASAAVSTANTASTNATTAVNTANAATATANSAASDAATALSTANAATSTANAASTAATNAVNTANSATSAASSAVSTANTASTNASNAVTTANTASTNATTAVNTANAATVTANAAAAAVANAVLYTTVANVAAIPATPANNTAVEVTNSTGIESFTPLSGLPVGFVGSSGLSVRIIYQTAGTTWTWIQYFPNDPEARYLKLVGGTVTGNLAVSGTLTKSGNNVVTVGDTGTVTSTMIANGTIVDADVNASAAIAGTKISPDFGSQTVQTTGIFSHALGTAGAPTITFTGDTNTGIYSPGADQVAISTNGTEGMRLDSSGRLGLGTSSPATLLDLSTTTSAKLNLTYPGFGIATLASDSTGALLLQADEANTQANSLIQFKVDGTERARIDSSGRLGVGTTPSAKLHVSGTTRIINGDSAGASFLSPSLDLYDSTHAVEVILTPASGLGAIGTYSNHPFAFYTNNAERARIDSSGRLGIGTSSPQCFTTINGGNSAGFTDVLQLSAGAAAANSGPGLSFNINHGDYSTYKSWQTGIIRSAANNAVTYEGFLAFYTNDGGSVSTVSEKMRITAQGRVGIGTTVPSSALTINNDGVGFRIERGSAVGYFYHNSTASTADLTIQSQAGAVQLFTENGANQPIKFTTNGTERCRVDSSGRLLIGTSTATATSTAKLQGNSFSSLSHAILYLSRGVNNPADGNDLGKIHFSDSSENLGAAIYAFRNAGTWTSGSSHPTALAFSTTADGASSPTERVRIGQNGYLKASNTGSYIATSNAYHELVGNAGNELVARITNTHASSPYGVNFVFQNATPNNATNYFINCADSTADRATIRSNGGLANYSANNVNLSDRNAKKDITLAAGTWDCLKKWEIVNFRYKDQPDDADLNMGVIAQQVAESCPEVISVFQEATQDQPEKLGVKDQQMMWMAIKALQEAQLRIETLEAEVAALKAS
jgi:hypothetical protein